MRECKSRIGVLKSLYISHQAVNLIGDPFNKVLLREFYPNTLPTPKAPSSEDYLLGILVANYYNLIVTYAHYYEDIKDFIRIPPEEIVTAITDADPNPMIKLLTFKNIVKYFGIIKDSFQGALIGLKQTGLIEKMVDRLLTDLVPIYNLMSRVLKLAMKNIFHIEKAMAIMLDELYRDTLQTTTKIQSFIEKISDRLPGKNLLLNSFEYYTLDHEFNKIEEQFMLPLKKSTLSESMSFIDNPWEFLKQDYQNFTIGTREYNIDSETWNNIAKFNIPSKKDLKECNSASPSFRSNLVKSIVSPRMTVKRFDFHKAHSATPQMFKSLQLGREDSPQEIHSARLEHESVSAGHHKKELSVSSVSSLNEENRHHSLLNSQSQYFGHSTNSWNLSSSNSTNMDRLLLNSSSPKKSGFKSFFGVKSKSTKQIMPLRPLGPLLETRNKE